MKVDLGRSLCLRGRGAAPGVSATPRALSGASASGLSEAVRRLEAQLGVRLLNRTTRSVAPTEAGAPLARRGWGRRLSEVEAALDIVNGFRDRPAGTLRLNVPASVARLVLPAIVPPFLAAYPEIRLEVVGRRELRRRAGGGLRCRHPLRRTARAGHDRGADRPARAALRGGRLAGLSRSAWPAANIPRDLLDHACLARPLSQRRDAAVGVRARWRGGAVWSRAGPLMSQLGGAVDLPVDAAVGGARASSTCSRTAASARPYLRVVARRSLSWSHGGRAFPGPTCTTSDGV